MCLSSADPSFLFVLDTPSDTPLPSGAATPTKLLEVEPRLGSKIKNGALKPRSPRSFSPRKGGVVFNEDIEPDDLIPAFLDTKAKLFSIQRPKQDIAKVKKSSLAARSSEDNAEETLLLSKLDRILKDVLFDKAEAEIAWRESRISLEKEYAATKKAKEEDMEKVAKETNVVFNGAEDINEEAERIAAEILAENEDDSDDNLADLFASLPVSEVDPVTGKTNTVMNSSDGLKIVIKDFGKWTGVNPVRVLEEACRARCVKCHLQSQRIG